MTDIERTFDPETDTYPLPEAKEQPTGEERDDLSQELLEENDEAQS